MSNSISNINIKNPIKGFVSKRRKRYQKDGFNLDLAYIKPNLIAMGFPAEKLEGVYRNHIDDVKRFLDTKHKNQYKVYNLCSERRYDINRFEHVGIYPFDDHNPPNIELIKNFCDDVNKWLNADERNVAAVHCKAGKGRTGTMICCYLLYSGKFKTAADALSHYAQTRTHDEKGVTIPSQRRYVEYYSYLLKSGKQYNPVTLQICEIKLSPPPLLNSHQGTIWFSISDPDKKYHCAQVPEFRKTDSCVLIRMDRCIPLAGDIKVEFSCNKVLGKEKLFHFWFNTFFVVETAEVRNDGNLIYKLTKSELDDAHKDKSHKTYVQDFVVEVTLQKITTGPFADPYRMLHPRPITAHLDTNTNATNHLNSNHNILSTRNNASNGQPFTFNNHRPAPQISVGGPGGVGLDCVDNSNTLMATTTSLLPPTELHTPSETSETSSSSEQSSSGEEWESEEYFTPERPPAQAQVVDRGSFGYRSIISDIDESDTAASTSTSSSIASSVGGLVAATSTSNSSTITITAPTTKTSGGNSRIEFMDFAKRRLSNGPFKTDLMPYLSIFKSPRKRRDST